MKIDANVKAFYTTTPQYNPYKDDIIYSDAILINQTEATGAWFRITTKSISKIVSKPDKYCHKFTKLNDLLPTELFLSLS